jgi:hypothetical protein
MGYGGDDVQDSQRYNDRPSNPDTSYDGIYMTGYMFDDEYQVYRIPEMANWNFVYGNDVSWDETTHKYTLVDTYQRGSDETYEDAWSKAATNYHYTCASETESVCDEVYYTFLSPSYMHDYSFKLKNGKKYTDAVNTSFSNVKDSAIKKRIDDWYAQTMTSFTDKIEDVVYCNDRSIATPYIYNGGALVSKDYSAKSELVYFLPQFRLRIQNQPSVNCPNNERDGFTVSAERGNGKLTYPVGVLTADESVMAGAHEANSSNNWSSATTYLSGSDGGISSVSNFWLMSTSQYGETGWGISGRAFLYDFYDNGQTRGDAYQTWNTRWTRPVVALIHDTYIKKGTGRYTDPLVLTWE